MFYKKRLKSCWISDLPELNVRRAPGLTCISALETIMKGREPINNSKGCGGIMRIAPFSLNYNYDIRKMDEEAARIWCEYLENNKKEL